MAARVEVSVGVFAVSVSADLRAMKGAELGPNMGRKIGSLAQPCRSGVQEHQAIAAACKHVWEFRWCGREDSNFHGLPHSDLNAARLPIPPRPHVTKETGRNRPAACSKSLPAKQALFGRWLQPPTSRLPRPKDGCAGRRAPPHPYVMLQVWRIRNSYHFGAAHRANFGFKATLQTIEF